MVALYKPTNFDPAQFEDGERLIYLAHILYIKRFYRDETHRGLEVWEPLYSQYLKNVMGEHYYKYVKRALEIGLIEKDERRNYSVGRYSTHYRIGEQYRMNKFEYFNVRNRYVKGGMAKASKAQEQGLPPEYKFVVSWLNQVEIGLVPVDLIYQACVEVKKDSPMTFEERLEYFVGQIENIQNKSVCPLKDKYGRLHSSITNLKSLFRPYLKLNGKDLVEIDIKTSQPLFLGMIVREIVEKANPVKSHIQGSIQDKDIPYVVDLEEVFAREEDLTEYFRLLEEGDLYEFMRKASESEETREDFKGMMFAYMFGPNLTDTNKVLRSFNEHFPTIAKVINETKQVDKLKVEYQAMVRQKGKHFEYREFIDKFKDLYSVLACQLQEKESSFIFGRVVHRLMREFPEVPVLTIHDSILTTAGNEGTIERIMMEEFAGLRVKAQLKIRR